MCAWKEVRERLRQCEEEDEMRVGNDGLMRPGRRRRRRAERKETYGDDGEGTGHCKREVRRGGLGWWGEGEWWYEGRGRVEKAGGVKGERGGLEWKAREMEEAEGRRERREGGGGEAAEGRENVRVSQPAA